jgi:CRISPR/Cas system endoribonuclease Cas6 (RAMP superfamily)
LHCAIISLSINPNPILPVDYELLTQNLPCKAYIKKAYSSPFKKVRDVSHFSGLVCDSGVYDSGFGAKNSQGFGMVEGN